MSMHSVPIGNSLNCGNCGVAGNLTSQTSCGCCTLSQIYPHWNWNSKLNTKLRLEFQVEYGFKLEFQVE